MNGNAINLFKKISELTWLRLMYAKKFGLSQSEETITDINSLEIAISGIKGLKVVKMTKPKEAQFGVDFELWVGDDYNGWWKYAIQAKKLSIGNRSSSYKNFRHKVKSSGKPQLELLKQYSEENRCIPLYCLYNYVDDNLYRFWKHYNFPYGQTESGCTVASLDVIESAYNQTGAIKFIDVHNSQKTVPWHYLLNNPKCQPQKNMVNNLLASTKHAQVLPHNVLPHFLRESNEKNIVNISSMSGDFYDKGAGIYPRWVIAVNQDRE